MRKIVLGVTGSIAAYKAAELVRLFVKNGDEVHVIMTPAACEFVRPLTFQTLSRNPVLVDQFAPPVAWMPEHISLADCADLVVVAPATANTIAKMRHGIADNLLTATLLATKAPVVVAPVMNTGARLAHGGKRLRQQVVERFAAPVARFEFFGLGAQSLVAQRGIFLAQRLDPVDGRKELFYLPVAA